MDRPVCSSGDGSVGQQFADRPAQYGVYDIGTQLSQRGQDKQAIMHPWMRYDKVILAYDQIIKKQEVQIDSSRPPAFAPYSAQGIFDALEHLEASFMV